MTDDSMFWHTLAGGLLWSRCCAKRVWGFPPRCTGCGHRVPAGSYVPRQTRYVPSLWLTEHWQRRQARRQR